MLSLCFYDAKQAQLIGKVLVARSSLWSKLEQQMFSSITKSTPNLEVLGRWGEVLSNLVLRCRWRRPMDSVTRLPPWGWEWLGWSAVGRICQVVFRCILFTKFNPQDFAGWRPFWWRCSTARLEKIVCWSALLIIASWASSRKKGRCCRYLNIFRMFQI